MNNISIIGAGYVGFSLGVLLSQKNNVLLLDIDQEKVSKINKGESIISDQDINKFFRLPSTSISATSSLQEAIQNKDIYIIATPTDFDEKANTFDTSSVEKMIEVIMQNSDNGLIVIKSTVPIGFTENMNTRHSTNRILFSPEFLREGRAVYDNLYPSRIIIGGNHPDQFLFTDLLTSISIKEDVDVMYMSSSEAEAVKLFSNTYLAMRVSFFNELDSFALSENLNTKNIIDGVSLDNRIGGYYNNPSFGYGGYCLPKDTKQLLANYSSAPKELVQATIFSNESRKNFLVKKILEFDVKAIGVYRLAMKLDSDNFRESAVLDILSKLNKKGLEILIYEPLITNFDFRGWQVLNDLNEFKSRSEIILSNRNHADLEDVLDKVFTRDIFGIN